LQQQQQLVQHNKGKMIQQLKQQQQELKSTVSSEDEPLVSYEQQQQQPQLNKQQSEQQQKLKKEQEKMQDNLKQMVDELKQKQQNRQSTLTPQSETKSTPSEESIVLFASGKQQENIRKPAKNEQTILSTKGSHIATFEDYQEAVRQNIQHELQDHINDIVNTQLALDYHPVSLTCDEVSLENCKIEIRSVDDSFFKYRLIVTTKENDVILYQFITYDMGLEVNENQNERFISWRGMNLFTIHADHFTVPIVEPEFDANLKVIYDEVFAWYTHLHSLDYTLDEILFQYSCNLSQTQTIIDTHTNESNDTRSDEVPCEIIIYRKKNVRMVECIPDCKDNENNFNLIITPNTRHFLYEDEFSVGIELGEICGLYMIMFRFQSYEGMKEFYSLIIAEILDMCRF
jgi:hypothetical protein